MGDDLVRLGAVGRGELLPLPLAVVHRLGEGDALHPGHQAVRLEQLLDLAVDGDGEGILLHGRLVVAVGGWSVVEPDGIPQGGRRGPGDAHGKRGHPVRLQRVEPAGARKAPRAVHHDADTEALGFPEGDALHATGLDGDLLVLAANDAHIRVGGALLRGGVESAAGKVSHGPGQCTRGAAGPTGPGPPSRADGGTCWLLPPSWGE